MLYTRRLRRSFLSLCLYAGFFVCIFLLVFTVYRLVATLSQVFPGFVGRDYLSLVHYDDLCTLFLAFGRCNCILCSCSCIIFSSCVTPLGSISQK
jgi:hypothetical protein